MRDELSLSDGVFRELMANVGLDQATIERMLASDTYVNAEEAISLGIINSIETEII
jgi:ATP-dependent protease ClpP protease subunit